jgi:hypothetical protein
MPENSTGVISGFFDVTSRIKNNNDPDPSNKP